MSEDLATWLLQQIAEDERLARDGEAACPHLDLCSEGGGDYYDAFGFDQGPGRVLAECDAKRRIITEYRNASDAANADRTDASARVGMFAFGLALQALALPYADRPGYRVAWRPADASS